MSDWISLDAESVSRATMERKREGGVQITVALSPYDIPDAVRGTFDRVRRKFLIEFSYIAEEPWESHVHEEAVTLHVGKNSGRIYRIEIDVETARRNNVGMRINLPKLVKRALDTELGAHEQRSRNFEIAKDVISDRRLPLFEELAGV